MSVGSNVILRIRLPRWSFWRERDEPANVTDKTGTSRSVPSCAAFAPGRKPQVCHPGQLLVVAQSVLLTRRRMARATLLWPALLGALWVGACELNPQPQPPADGTATATTTTGGAVGTSGDVGNTGLDGSTSTTGGVGGSGNAGGTDGTGAASAGGSAGSGTGGDGGLGGGAGESGDAGAAGEGGETSELRAWP